MKFVHIEDFFHPDAGYQVNLLTKLQIDQGHQVTIVTSELDKVPSWLTAFFGKDNIREKDAAFTMRTGVEVVRIPLLGFYSGRSIYHRSIFRKVNALQPDVLFIHGEDTLIAMEYLRRVRKLKYPIVFDCHMLEMASENRFKEIFRYCYRKYFAPIILKNNIPLIRVVDSDYVEKCLGIPLSHTELLSFGTDTKYFSPNAVARKTFRKELGIADDAFVVLYAGKLDSYKGGMFLAEALKAKLSPTKYSSITFIVVGNTADEYGATVEKLFNASENRIVRFGTQSYLDLARFYQAADIAIYPKQCSLSFFEAQSCGLPVLFEENEINNQRAEWGGALTFKPGDVTDFRNMILHLESMPESSFAQLSELGRNYVLTHYNYAPIAQRFTDIMIETNQSYHKTKMVLA